MVETPNRIEALLDEGEFLGRLARALVRDENLADDLVQETWLAALRRPPEGDARSWFAVVARNLVRRGGRADSSRAQRERSVARSERIPSPEEIQRRESLRGLVVEKVLGLPAIYRDVVLLRFFENWKPRRIARELGCPVETVNTRLKRALEHLRDDLDRESGGQRALWALGLVHAGRAKLTSAPLAKGVLLMSTKTKVAIGIVLVAGLAGTASILLHRTDSVGTIPPVDSGDRLTRSADERSPLPAAAPRAPASEVPPIPTSGPAGNTTAPSKAAHDPGVRDLLSQVESLSTAMFNGTASSADVQRIASGLLSHLDKGSAIKAQDGTTVYQLVSDADFGDASLHVDPSKAGKPDEYEIVVNKRAVSGYNGNNKDVEKSDFRIRLGSGSDGKMGFTATTEDYLRISDPSVMSALTIAGRIRVGGALSSRGNDVYWAECHGYVMQMPNGNPGWATGFDQHPTVLEKGSFSSESLVGIQAVLAGLNGH